MLLLCILTFVFSTVSCETEVQMAVLLPNDSYRLFSVDKLLPAIEIGIERVQKTLVPDVKFNVSYADTKCHIGIAINEAIKFRYSGIVHAFFGPVCDYAVAPVARQSKFWNIPVISVGAMASEFSDFRKKDYPYLIRAGPVNFNNVAEYFKHMFDYYSWRKFKIIYERKGQDVFEDFCHIMSVAIYYNLKADSSNTTSDYFKLDPQVDLGNLLVTETGHSYGVVVLCASADSVRDIMIKANELNFDNGEYVFLNIDLFSSKEDSEKPWYRENDTPERNQKARKAYEALMTVTLRKPTSPAYRGFSEEVKKRAGNDSFTYGEDEVNSFVGAFHDAVILYALALNETLANNRSITNGTEITHRMWNRTFEGITGTVSIDVNGDRNADYSLLDMNPTTGKFEVVANYFGKDKKYMPVREKKIHWAGNRKSAPPDTPKCGFDGAKCPPEKPFPEYGIVIIVLGTLLVIVLVAAFFIYRHIKLEAELAEMNWRVRWDDIMFGTMENDRKMRRQGSNLSLTRTTNGEVCSEGRVLIERSDAHELDWCQCGQCEAAENPTKRVCCRQLELYGILQEGGTCITSNKEFRDVVLNRDVLLAVFIHVMLIRRQRGVAPVKLTACKLRLMATRQFLCWVHRGQRLKKESRMAVPSCVSRAIRIEFPDDNTDDNSGSSVNESSVTGVIPLDTIA